MADAAATDATTSEPRDDEAERCETEPPETDPMLVLRCPRCGGESLPRRRRPSRINPFLTPPPPSNAMTCVDCGLDFDADL